MVRIPFSAVVTVINLGVTSCVEVLPLDSIYYTIVSRAQADAQVGH